MSKLSSEYVSDSDGENDEESTVFSPPSGYSKCKHLKKFHKMKSDEQLWLIKLPAKLDISKLKTLPIDFSGKENNEVVITTDEGKAYSINEDITQRESQDNSNLTLLVPDESRDSLRVSGDKGKSLPFDKVLFVSEVASIPSIDYEKMKVPRSDVVKVKGLKLRHYATGCDPKDETSQEEKKSKKRSAKEALATPSKKHSKKDKKKSKK